MPPHDYPIGTGRSGVGFRTTGRRGAPRLRLSIPARLTTVFEARACVLIDLSRTGAQVALMDPLPEGEGGMLRVAGLDVFGEAVRRSPGVNGLAFEQELSHDAVLAVRRFAERLAIDELHASRERARTWIEGVR
jgi:hypothetical protein